MRHRYILAGFALVTGLALVAGLALLHFIPPATVTTLSRYAAADSLVGPANQQAAPEASGTATTTPIPLTPDPQLVGHVTWQGRPAQPNTLDRLPITLTLQVGGMLVNYPNLQTDTRGVFTVPVGMIAPGPVTWWVKGPSFLAVSGAGTLTGAAVTSLEMGTQPAGDVNNDNLADTTDFGLARASFGRTCGDPAYDSRADFNGDCLVDSTDFSLLRGNFGQSGTLAPLATCTIFPANNIWNRNIAALPVHVLSAVYLASIGITSTAHADFGSGLYQGGPIGIPYIMVPGSQPPVPVSFTYASESDPGPYPVPTNAPIEEGPNSSGDRHILLVDRDSCTLQELYKSYPNPDGSWQAGSGARWSLTSNALRPNGWTSGDAAGLPILAGLARYDELASGTIRHALRFTAPAIQAAHIWPARHHDTNGSIDPALPPMGLRVRLRADFDMSGFPAQSRIVLQALKDYGMILADSGPAWHITGAPDPRWNNTDLHSIETITGAAFEVIDESSLMVDPNSGQSR